MRMLRRILHLEGSTHAQLSNRFSNIGRSTHQIAIVVTIDWTAVVRAEYGTIVPSCIKVPISRCILGLNETLVSTVGRIRIPDIKPISRFLHVVVEVGPFVT